jgi:hypothetical protein
MPYASSGRNRNKPTNQPHIVTTELKGLISSQLINEHIVFRKEALEIEP